MPGSISWISESVRPLSVPVRYGGSCREDSICITRNAAPRRRHSEVSACCALAADVPAHRAQSSEGARGGADGLPSRRRGSASSRRKQSDLDRLVSWRTLRPVAVFRHQIRTISGNIKSAYLTGLGVSIFMQARKNLLFYGSAVAFACRHGQRPYWKYTRSDRGSA